MKSSLLLLKLVLGALVVSALHAVAVVPPAAAAAAVRWASPTGTGDGTACSQADPCDLETAVEHASVQDGDEVIVTPGDYSVVTLYVTKAITLHGQAGQPRPTVTTSGQGVTVGAAATVRDLALVHTNNGPGLWTNTAGAVIERVTSKMTAVGGFACAPTATSTWRDSVCWATATNSRGMGANAGFPASTRTITLRNVTAVGVGAGLGFDFNGTGINVLIDAKNVIASSPAADVRAAGDNGASVQITMTNSSYADETELSTRGGAGSVTDPGSGTNQTMAPVFVDAANGDFHQAEGSPTIDAGAVDDAIGATDLDGDPRVLGTISGPCPALPGPALPDIGADERVTALDCNPPAAVAPDTTWTGTPKKKVLTKKKRAKVTFGFTSTTPGSFECSLDGAAFRPCASPLTFKAKLGKHLMRVRAVGVAGVADQTPAVYRFKVKRKVAN